jgi:hypothetical protein
VLRKVLKRLKTQGKAAKQPCPSVLDDPNLSFNDLKAIWQASIERERIARTQRNED